MIGFLFLSLKYSPFGETTSSEKQLRKYRVSVGVWSPTPDLQGLPSAARGTPLTNFDFFDARSTRHDRGGCEFWRGLSFVQRMLAPSYIPLLSFAIPVHHWTLSENLRPPAPHGAGSKLAGVIVAEDFSVRFAYKRKFQGGVVLRSASIALR